jgi:hypothetical protein
MGRTIPSFRIALAMEKAEWKPFRNFPLSAVTIFRKDREALETINAKAMSGAIQFVRNSRLIFPNTAEIFFNKTQSSKLGNYRIF